MNNIGVYLTEQQIRNLVREELKAVLLEQEEQNKKSGIFQTIKKSGPLIAALLGVATMAGHTSIQPSSAGQGTQQTADQGLSENDLVAARGINPDKKMELIKLAGLNDEQVKKMKELFIKKDEAEKRAREKNNQQIKPYQDKLDEINQNPEKYREDAAEIIQNEIDKLKMKGQQEISDAGNYYIQQIENDPALIKGFLNAGQMTVSYLMNNKPVGNGVKNIQADILKYGLEQAEGIALKVAEDDIYTFNKEYVKKDFYMGSSGISDPKTLAMSWLVTHDKDFQTYLTQHPDEEFTAIEIATALGKAVPEFEANINNYFIPNGQALVSANARAEQSDDVVTGMQALDSAGDYQEKMNVGQEITPEQAKNMSEEEINKLPQNVRQAVRDMKAGLKENKLNKIRQRLNELRGVYV